MNEYVREAAKKNGIMHDDKRQKPKRNLSISTKLRKVNKAKKGKNLRKTTGHNAGMGGRMAAGYG